MAQTLQQERAKEALLKVRHYKEQGVDKKKFKARASELPFMIHANGLGQALAFFLSQGNTHGHRDLYDILSGWLVKEGRPFHGKGNALEGVTQCDRSVYMAAQSEAMLFMEWVKKFSDAFMADGSGNNANANAHENANGDGGGEAP